ncbi:MAG TPA: hypothetical protein VGN34_19475 [Ktedonobacteraceae bacterium]
MRQGPDYLGMELERQQQARSHGAKRVLETAGSRGRGVVILLAFLVLCLIVGVLLFGGMLLLGR